MHFSTLSEWLNWIKSIHVAEMDLSLERVTAVGERLKVLTPSCPVITVAGTNGKGSCVAGLEAIYQAAGYRVGCFTTPFLFRHHEQVRVLGHEASDNDFCAAYAAIEKARGDISLTPFEFNALAAFIIFTEAKLDIWLLEVGLGGRWDAVNAINTDLAVVASIGIDHTDWLGDTREKIGFEKAGIFREGKPVVCGDLNPPYSLIRAAEVLNAPFYCQNKEFGFTRLKSSWNGWHSEGQYNELPLPRLALQNCATVLQAIELMQPILPVTECAIRQGFSTVQLLGRIQVLPGDVTTVFDVSHNPAAASYLASWLQENPIAGKTRAVFSMLADKDIVSTLLVMKEWVTDWYTAPIVGDRGTSVGALTYCFRKVNISAVQSYAFLQESYQTALSVSAIGDRLVVFGSFHTVREALLRFR